jgi:hypothetical protein
MYLKNQPIWESLYSNIIAVEFETASNKWVQE